MEKVFNFNIWNEITYVCIQNLHLDKNEEMSPVTIYYIRRVIFKLPQYKIKIMKIYILPIIIMRNTMSTIIIITTLP